MPASYTEMEFRVPPELTELWSWHCFESGASGIETVSESESSVQMRVFFPGRFELNVEQLLEGFHREFANSGPFIQQVGQALKPVQDWQAEWRQYFPPVNIGRSLRVVPPWHQECSSERQFLVIDPGQGFGTGHHESTALVLTMLEEHLRTLPVPPELMIDVGIGSGILSIAGCLLGVRRALGVDLAAEAVAEVSRNASLNGVSERIVAWVGAPEQLAQPAPLVVSNMLWHELRSVREDLVRLTLPGGFVICSGLLHEQAVAFARELADAGMTLLHQESRNEWSGLLLRKS